MYIELVLLFYETLNICHNVNETLFNIYTYCYLSEIIGNILTDSFSIIARVCFLQTTFHHAFRMLCWPDNILDRN